MAINFTDHDVKEEETYKRYSLDEVNLDSEEINDQKLFKAIKDYLLTSINLRTKIYKDRTLENTPRYMNRNESLEMNNLVKFLTIVYKEDWKNNYTLFSIFVSELESSDEPALDFIKTFLDSPQFNRNSSREGNFDEAKKLISTYMTGQRVAM